MTTENSFDEENEICNDEMLSMAQIIDIIKKLQNSKQKVYCGKGVFKEFTVSFNKEITDNEIKKILKKHPDFKVSDEYLELLKFSNGISFFEYGDDCILSLQEAFEYSDNELLDDGYLQIATYGEDAIYMKCDGSERNMYVSLEGFGDLIPLNMSFSAFLEASLISNFSYFWLWGTDDYDLY